MGKNKAVTIMLSMIVAIALVGTGGYFIFAKFSSQKTEAAEPTADDLQNLSVDTDEITTNLLDNSYVKIRFKIETDNTDAKSELEKRLFQVNNIIIYEIAGMKTEDLQGRNGLIDLENKLRDQISKIMHSGKIVRVYTTEKIIQ